MQRPRTYRLTTSAAAALSLAALAATAPPVTAAGNVDLPRAPSISPDGARIVFSWRGDLWRVDATGGTATRLTSHPADEIHSVWSRDGQSIAFSSTRTGARSVYTMNTDGTEIRRLTDIDVECVPTGFGVDRAGRAVVLFHAALEGDVYREFRPYMVSTGGGPLRRLHDAFGSYPTMTADGSRVAFQRGGYYDRRESRRHYRGAEAADVWIADRTADAPAADRFRRVTTFDGNDRRPRWSGGNTLLFLSDRTLSTVNLYRTNVDADDDPARLTAFSGRDVQSYDVSADGARAVLHVWDTLYTLALDVPGALPVPLRIHAAEDARDDVELKTIDDLVTEAALSPDGKVMAFVAYGDVYVRATADEAATRRVTRGEARERGIAWSPDGLRLYFVSDRDGTESIFAASVERTRGEVKTRFAEGAGVAMLELGGEDADAGADADADAHTDAHAHAHTDAHADADADADTDTDAHAHTRADADADAALPAALDPARWRDALTFDVVPVVQRSGNDRDPRPSPDGKRLAFRGTRGNVHVLDLETGAISDLVESWDAEVEMAWGPGGRYVAYALSDLDFNRDIFVAPVDAPERAVNVTRHPDDDQMPRFSADGRVLAFVSERINEEFDVWMVFLDRELEVLTPHERETYFEKARAAAKSRKPLPTRAEDAATEPDAARAPFEPDLDDAYLRVRRITTVPGDESDLAITPAGDRVVFTAGGAEPGLYAIGGDGKDRTRLGDRAAVGHLSLDGAKAVVVRAGRAATVELDGGKTETVEISDRIRIDLAAQSSQKFLEAARGLGEGYYHPTMNGLDWARVTADYHELARRARTADEFNWVANRFIGELNGSHLRISASDPAPPAAETSGRLGVVAERVETGWKITRVVPLSPAAQGPMRLRVDDVITAIEGRPFDAIDTLESHLRERVGRETLVTIERPGAAGGATVLDALMAPVSFDAERQLKYDAWRNDTARRVAGWTDGRVGYIHIQAMGQPALDVFERDLFAAADGKDGLIIDVRNNGGGWTTDRVLASIMVTPHAYTIPRGADPADTGHYPQPRLFIQRYTMPMNLLCNEKSYSNAEIMSHAFKTLQRGTLVGQTTHGSVISTGGWSLIDGTWVRLPFRGWYVPDGTDMELNGAVPDLIVPQTPEAEARGDDEQLRAAVDDLLERLP